MPDQDTPVPAVAPETIKVPVIQGTGDGRLPSSLQGTLLPTPGTANPNVVMVVVPVLLALAVRAGHMFFSTFVATISAAGASSALGGPDVLSRIDLETAVMVAGSAVLVDGAKNCLTIFARLETKFPLMTGSV